MTEKPHINLVFMGHVDHGKSTLVGRLLYEVGEVTEQTMKKYKDEAEKLGKATFEFAWVMDSLKEEGERSHHRHSAQEVPDPEELLHNNRCSGTQGLREEHDNRRFPGRRCSPS